MSETSGKALITEETLSDIGDAIRAKNGASDTYLPGEMPAAIRGIPSGGGGTTDYDELTNKPSINGHTLTGNQTGAALGLVDASDALALGETSATAYRGDRGKAAYDHAAAKGAAFASGLYKITTNAEGHVTAAAAAAKADITALGIPGQDTTYGAATQSAAGLMSAADKTKLDGISMDTMTMAQYEALTQAQKMDGTVRFITDVSVLPAAEGVGF